MTLFWLIQPISSYHDRSMLWQIEGACILIVSTFAALVFWATLRTFDRRTGRIPERRRS